MKKAVLFLVFNRLDVVERVFKEIRRAQPPRLYIASDGVREDREGEDRKVKKVQEYILNNIDWDCEVKTLFREENLGCRKAVSSAITWFFKNEKDGIILEDDCLPNQSFFSFCEELLDFYKDNKKVMHISGDQFVPNFDNGASYYFAKIQHCWGWATWADRWNNYYGTDLKSYSEDNLKKFGESQSVQSYWKNILKKMKNDKIDSWAYQWAFKIVENNGLCINPSVNLISNIGFNKEGTHTKDNNNPFANMPVYEMDEIIHPSKFEFNKDAVDYIYRKHFNILDEFSFLEKELGQKKQQIIQKNAIIKNKEQEILHLQNSKSFQLGDLFFRSIKKPYKLITFPVNFLRILGCFNVIKNMIKKIINKLNFIEKKQSPKKYISEEWKVFEENRVKDRFKEEKIFFKNREIVVPDAVSFAYQVSEIFIQHIYKFKSKSKTDSPVIYDCGANVGTSILYFKQLYPNCSIRAFEPDNKIYSYLEKNISNLENIKLYKKAAWIKDEVLTFNSEGADGGSLVGSMENECKVDAIRLKDFLDKEKVVHFLKIDIEGPEVEVLNDCANSLGNVENIFIEYHSFKNKKQDLDKILNILKKNGFRYYTDTIKKPPLPFISIDNDNSQMDFQVNVFGVKK